MSQLFSLSLTRIRDLLRSGEISAQEATRSCLDRIAATEPRLEALLHIAGNEALDQAKAMDADGPDAAKPLWGVPVIIKDVLATVGMPTTCGSRILENFVPVYDAHCVTRLKEAGAIILAKANMDEFAMGSSTENSAFKVTKNPWDTSRVPGGSSGGSAASVAAGQCFASIGTDTGGSIRQPASFCGIVGVKPTYGRVSRRGLIAYGSSLDQAGPMTRTVADAAQILQVIAGHDPKDSTSVSAPVPDYLQALENTESLKGLRLGMPEQYWGEGLSAEVDQACRSAIELAESLGAEIVPVSLPHTEYAIATYYILAMAEASSNLARFDGVRYGYRDRSAGALIDLYNRSRSQGFGDEVKRRILIGTYALSAGYYDAYYKKASQVRTLIKEDFARAYASCDLLVSPVVPTPAWQIGAGADDPLSLYLSDILTLSANLAGTPGMSVPCGFSSQGLPIGVQLQAAHFQEEILLRAAHNLEQRAGVVGRKPPLA